MDETKKAHGMDGSLVEADWPSLNLEEVRDLFIQFSGLDEPDAILSTSPRPFSAASVVAAGSKRVFVKRHHHSVRDREGLLEEHRFMQHLRRNGAAVSQVLESAMGETAIEAGEWTYEVHEIPAGVDLYEDALSWTPFRTEAHARSAGQALARLHQASRGYAASPRKPQPLVTSFSIFASSDPKTAMEHYLRVRPALSADSATRRCCSAALELLRPFHEELRLHLASLQPMWTHNDLHASNLFWSDATEGAQVTAIFDLGLADRTNAVHDLAQAIERNIVEWLVLVQDPTHPDRVPIHFDHLFAFLEGYESIRRLSVEERIALAPMVALSHAEFALSEADYFLGVLHSREKARLATEGYLVGHSRWYHCAAGESLLNTLRTWSMDRSRLVLEAVRR